jgi:hypothetical protein
MIQDAIGREITIGSLVFYNARVYRVKNFAKDGKRVMLNNAIGWQLVSEKLRKGDECCLIEDNPAITAWLLKGTK